jgi:hypothetical protein
LARGSGRPDPKRARVGPGFWEIDPALAGSRASWIGGDPTGLTRVSPIWPDQSIWFFRFYNTISQLLVGVFTVLLLSTVKTKINENESKKIQAPRQSEPKQTQRTQYLSGIFFMARGELDRPDPALIIEGSRRSHPSKRVQGIDYPIPVSEELRHREKGTHYGKS